MEKVLKNLPEGLVSDQDLKLLFGDASEGSRKQKIHRAVKAGDLIHLRRGLYGLGERYRRRAIHHFEVANRLYVPSYVSLESALAHYQLIPEAVYTTTSVTPRNPAEFSNALGMFSFQRLPLRIFQQGFVRNDEGDGPHYLIATPLKALLDLVFLSKKTYATLGEVENDLRLDLEALHAILRPFKNRAIADYKDIYRRENVAALIELILWELL